MRRCGLVATCATAVILASCGVPQVDDFPNNPTVLINSYYNYGVADRDLKLSVGGDPFAVPPAAFDQAVESDAQRSAEALPRQPTHPTLTPGPSADTNFELRLIFDPPRTLVGDAACGPAMPPSAPPGGGDTVRVHGAFCMEGRALTEADGRVAAAGPDDPQFAGMLNQMMLALFRPDLSQPGAPNGGMRP